MSTESQATFRTALAPDAARKRAISVLTGTFKGRILGPEGAWDVVGIGSRAGFRTWGLWGLRAHRRLPLVAHLRATANNVDATSIEVRFASDEGWYAYRLKAVERAYGRAYAELVAALREALEATRVRA